MSADMMGLLAVGIARGSGFKISVFDWPQRLSEDKSRERSVGRSDKLLFATAGELDKEDVACFDSAGNYNARIHLVAMA